MILNLIEGKCLLSCLIIGSVEDNFDLSCICYGYVLEPAASAVCKDMVSIN